MAEQIFKKGDKVYWTAGTTGVYNPATYVKALPNGHILYNKDNDQYVACTNGTHGIRLQTSFEDEAPKLKKAGNASQ
jgi:hypothetical protein